MNPVLACWRGTHQQHTRPYKQKAIRLCRNVCVPHSLQFITSSFWVACLWIETTYDLGTPGWLTVVTLCGCTHPVDYLVDRLMYLTKKQVRRFLPISCQLCEEHERSKLGWAMRRRHVMLTNVGGITWTYMEWLDRWSLPNGAVGSQSYSHPHARSYQRASYLKIQRRETSRHMGTNDDDADVRYEYFYQRVKYQNKTTCLPECMIQTICIYVDTKETISWVAKRIHRRKFVHWIRSWQIP